MTAALPKINSTPQQISACEKCGLVTAPALARILGFGRTAIYQMAADGRIPHIRIGSSIRFDPLAIAQWLRERTVKAA